MSYALAHPQLMAQLLNRFGNLQMPYQNQPATLAYPEQQLFNQTNPFELNGNQISSQEIQILQQIPDDGFIQPPFQFTTTEQVNL
jgi:hypothetical protein